MKTGWVFIYGVDGFGADTAPAHEEGVYLNFDKAFKRLCELNEEVRKINGRTFYEVGYSEDEYPDNDIKMKEAEESEDWELYESLLEKHKLTNIEEICRTLCINEEPYYGFYAIEEIEIFE